MSLKKLKLSPKIALLALFLTLVPTINIQAQGSGQRCPLSESDKQMLKKAHKTRHLDFFRFSPVVQEAIIEKIEEDFESRPSREEVRAKVEAFAKLSSAEKAELFKKIEQKRAEIFSAETDEEKLEIIFREDDFEKLIPPPPPRRLF